MKTTKKTKVANDGPRPTTEMSLAELQGYISMHEENIEGSKRRLEELTGELRRRFEPTLKEALAKQDKQSGQHTFEADGYKLTGEIRATVKWDSAALEQIASTLPYEQVKRMFKIEFSMPEKVFQSINEPKLLDRLIDARTVKYSEPKVSFSS